MAVNRVHTLFGIVLVLVLAGVSLLLATRPAAVAAQGEYPRLTEIASLGPGDAFLDPIWLSGNGKRVAYGVDIGSEPGLYNQWYIADTDGLSPPQRLGLSGGRSHSRTSGSRDCDARRLPGARRSPCLQPAQCHGEPGDGGLWPQGQGRHQARHGEGL